MSTDKEEKKGNPESESPIDPVSEFVFYAPSNLVNKAFEQLYDAYAQPFKSLVQNKANAPEKQRSKKKPSALVVYPSKSEVLNKHCGKGKQRGVAFGLKPGTKYNGSRPCDKEELRDFHLGFGPTYSTSQRFEAYQHKKLEDLCDVIYKRIDNSEEFCRAVEEATHKNGRPIDVLMIKANGGDDWMWWGSEEVEYYQVRGKWGRCLQKLSPKASIVLDVTGAADGGPRFENLARAVSCAAPPGARVVAPSGFGGATPTQFMVNKEDPLEIAFFDLSTTGHLPRTFGTLPDDAIVIDETNRGFCEAIPVWEGITWEDRYNRFYDAQQVAAKRGGDKTIDCDDDDEPCTMKRTVPQRRGRNKEYEEDKKEKRSKTNEREKESDVKRESEKEAKVRGDDRKATMEEEGEKRKWVEREAKEEKREARGEEEEEVDEAIHFSRDLLVGLADRATGVSSAFDTCRTAFELANLLTNRPASLPDFLANKVQNYVEGLKGHVETLSRNPLDATQVQSASSALSNVVSTALAVLAVMDAVSTCIELVKQPRETIKAIVKSPYTCVKFAVENLKALCTHPKKAIPRLLMNVAKSPEMTVRRFARAVGLGGRSRRKKKKRQRELEEEWLRQEIERQRAAEFSAGGTALYAVAREKWFVVEGKTLECYLHDLEIDARAWNPFEYHRFPSELMEPLSREVYATVGRLSPRAHPPQTVAPLRIVESVEEVEVAVQREAQLVVALEVVCDVHRKAQDSEREELVRLEINVAQLSQIIRNNADALRRALERRRLRDPN